MQFSGNFSRIIGWGSRSLENSGSSTGDNTCLSLRTREKLLCQRCFISVAESRDNSFPHCPTNTQLQTYLFLSNNAVWADCYFIRLTIIILNKTKTVVILSNEYARNNEYIQKSSTQFVSMYLIGAFVSIVKINKFILYPGSFLKITWFGKKT